MKIPSAVVRVAKDRAKVLLIRRFSSKPDGAGWKLHSVLPSQYNVMAVWEREEKRRKR